MDRETKIIKNSIIFSIGNLGSKILSYVMVILYTHYIKSGDLGYYDVVMTTIILLQPIVILALDEGVYRWLILAKEENKKQIISTCIKMVTFACVLTCLLLGFICFNLKLQYYVEIICLFASTVFYQFMLNSVRGLTNNKLYAYSGLFNSLILLVLEVVGIVVFGMGIEALLVSKIIANVVTILLIIIKQADFKGIWKVPYDKMLAKKIVQYSAPLIVNQISWWVVNLSDRYVVLGFLGNEYNGIYTIANKFPTVISIIAGILYFSFQESMIKEYNSNDRDEFYSSIFERYYVFLFSLALCGVPLTKLVIMYLVGDEYSMAWQYTGILFMGAVFCALSSFLGIGYQIAKETKKCAVTTIAAAVVNVLVNVALVQIIGLHAATVSTLVAYMFLFAIRLKQSKKYYLMKVRWMKFIMILLATVFSIVICYLGNVIILIVVFGISFAFFLFSNRKIVMDMRKVVK